MTATENAVAAAPADTLRATASADEPTVIVVRTMDVTGTITLAEDIKMVMPGDNVAIAVELITVVALEEQQRFAIREGGRTVGAGVITKIVE